MAPSARQVQKAEAKYGVATDYPDLQLHSAAANGNVGLVKYALMHGQPVNSVLNGVLPIHVAASSGNEMVVQMLIEAGADVNAARLPRKYNADRAKATSSIGAAGSTPLHFAAANGHDKVVLLLLSHGASPSIAEKHGLTAEDLARQAGHENVLTVLRLWKSEDPTGSNGARQRRESEDMESTLTVRGTVGSSGYNSPSRSLHPGSSASSVKDLRIGSPNKQNQGGQVASSSASMHSVSSARRLLGKPSLDTLSSKGKKLAKAASNPNLAALLHGHTHKDQQGKSPAYTPNSNPAHAFAPQPTALRQNPLRALTSASAFGTTPSQTMQRQSTLPNLGQASAQPHHIHHIINTDKARRPSLPSVFEKAAHPGQSLKHALGMTSASSSGGAFGSGRSNASSNKDNDPYHFAGARPKRSGSRTSLSSVFRPRTQSREGRGSVGGSESASQPLSPAASSFFTGDDELEAAEREAFVRTHSDRNQSASADDGCPAQLSSNYPYSRQHPAQYGQGPGGYGRSRAGSGSSAATTHSGSGRSYSQRGYSSTGFGSAAGPPQASSLAYPTTAPPTQSGFFFDPMPNSLRPLLPSNLSSSSSASIVIPAPIPPPPSSSTQPFFSKAAIPAAHNNPPVLSRPAFYRPRKSSQLSTSATKPSSSVFLHSPDVQQMPSFRSNSAYDEVVYDEDDETAPTAPNAGGLAGAPPSVVIRRPTIQEATSSYLRSRATRQSGSSSSDGQRPAFSPPPSASGTRHSRAASDDAGANGTRPSTALADVLEDDISSDSIMRQRSQSHTGAAMPTSDPPAQASELDDPEVAAESEDTFPTDQERPFLTRSRAGSRARVDSVGSTASSSRAFDSGSSSAGGPVGYQTSPALSATAAFPQSLHAGQDGSGMWHGFGAMTRPARSGSTTTDTRTSRSGSLGESQIPNRFLAFDYSSSPASSSSFYQPSDSTKATSVTSTPPGTASNATPQPSLRQLPSLQGAKVVTKAQAQTMVQQKEAELLSFQPEPATTRADLGHGKPHRLSLTQQLAAYGDSLAIAREISDAEKRRKDPAQPVTLLIPEPPASAKYSYEILGKESRTTMPVSTGKRAKDGGEKDQSAGNGKIWTHKMVSPFEVPLPRPGGSGLGHKTNSSIGSMTTITSSGKPFGRSSYDAPPAASSNSSKTLQVPSGTDPVAHATSQAGSIYAGREHALRTKGSTLSTHSQHLAPPSMGSDVSVHKRSPRLPSPSGKSPRSSTERDRPVNTYHVVAGPGSEATDSAGSSLVSEPRSVSMTMRHSSGTTDGSTSRHRHSRSDAHQVSQSPEMPSVSEETPRPPQLLRLETVMAPKYHTERRIGGEAAPSPTKHRFGKIGKLFK